MKTTHPLYPLWREWRIFILGWALEELPLWHKDVPHILLERSWHVQNRSPTR